VILLPIPRTLTVSLQVRAHGQGRISRESTLENGILLCLEHHGDYNNFRFSIHPETHKIFAFHPVTAALQGVEVKAPWDSPDSALYPPPLPPFLGMHYTTAIANAMKASEGDHELDFSNEDYEDSSELEEIQMEETQNEVVRTWRDGLPPDTPFDFMADNKCNIDTLAVMWEAVSV